MSEVCKLAQSKSIPSAGLATLPSSEIIPFARHAGISIGNWLDQMEFRLRSLNIPRDLWVAGLLSHVAPDVWTEMKKYLVDRDPSKTPYETFVSKLREIYAPPDLSRASLLTLSRVRQYPDENLSQFRTRVERLASKAYHHLSAKDREPMIVAALLSGLPDPHLAEHILSQKPTTAAEVERVASEFVQMRRSLSSARPRSSHTVDASLAAPSANSSPSASPRSSTSDRSAADPDDGFTLVMPRHHAPGRPSNHTHTSDHSHHHSSRPPASMQPPNQAYPHKPPALPANSYNRPSSPRSSNVSTPRSPPRCHNCQEVGHLASQCPQPQVCYKCGQPGHIAAKCPQRGSRSSRSSYPTTSSYSRPNAPPPFQEFSVPSPVASKLASVVVNHSCVTPSNSRPSTPIPRCARALFAPVSSPAVSPSPAIHTPAVAIPSLHSSRIPSSPEASAYIPIPPPTPFRSPAPVRSSSHDPATLSSSFAPPAASLRTPAQPTATSSEFTRVSPYCVDASALDSLPIAYDPSCPLRPRNGPLLLDLLRCPPSSLAVVREARKLLWLSVAAQNCPAWCLLDTGSVYNIVDRSYYDSLPYRPRPVPPDPRDCIVSGHNTALPVLGSVILPFIHDHIPYYHVFRVVDNFPVDMCLGAEFLKQHQCRINYGPGPSTVDIQRTTCDSCAKFSLQLASSHPSRVSPDGLPIAAPILPSFRTPHTPRSPSRSLDLSLPTVPQPILTLRRSHPSPAIPFEFLPEYFQPVKPDPRIIFLHPPQPTHSSVHAPTAPSSPRPQSPIRPRRRHVSFDDHLYLHRYPPAPNSSSEVSDPSIALVHPAATPAHSVVPARSRSPPPVTPTVAPRSRTPLPASPPVSTPRSFPLASTLHPLTPPVLPVFTPLAPPHPSLARPPSPDRRTVRPYEDPPPGVRIGSFIVPYPPSRQRSCLRSSSLPARPTSAPLPLPSGVPYPNLPPPFSPIHLAHVPLPALPIAPATPGSSSRSRGSSTSGVSTDRPSLPSVSPRPPPPRSPRVGPRYVYLGEISLDEIPLPAADKDRVRALLAENPDAFAHSDLDLGITRLLEHQIETGENPAFKIKTRPVPFKALEWLKKEIDKLLRAGIIRPSNSPYSSPIVIVPKKSAPGEPPKFRLCVDYRWLNDQTKKDAFPLPRICDILPALSTAKYFSSLDLASGYHQVPMAQSSIEKTAFSTPFGHYEYVTMPFGLTNAPATFQRLMNHIFADRIGVDLLVYLDDIIIFSSDLESHLTTLRDVLARLSRAGLKCQPAKCQLLRETLTYLGHTVSAQGISPDAQKLKVLEAWPLPRTGTEVLSFLGFCNYYRALVPNFAQLACELYPLGKLDHLDWTPSLTQTFESLRTALCRAPVLRLPNAKQPFVLETDASSVAVGAVLKQSDGTQEYPVSFFSATLTKTERNYSAYERELLALVRATAHFGIYLLYNTFVWRTDHAAFATSFVLTSNFPLASPVGFWPSSRTRFR